MMMDPVDVSEGHLAMPSADDIMDPADESEGHLPMMVAPSGSLDNLVDSDDGDAGPSY